MSRTLRALRTIVNLIKLLSSSLDTLIRAKYLFHDLYNPEGNFQSQESGRGVFDSREANATGLPTYSRNNFVVEMSK